MALLLALFLVVSLLASVFGTGLFLIVDHVALARRRLLFLCVVLFSLMPVLLHAHYAARWIANFGMGDQPGPGLYPALRHFLLIANAGVVGALFVAAALSLIAPLLCGLVPLGFAWLYWRTLLPLAFRDPPDGSVFVDNTPLLWVAGYTLIAAIVVLFASIRLRNPSFPWNLRWLSWQRMRSH